MEKSGSIEIIKVKSGTKWKQSTKHY